MQFLLVQAIIFNSKVLRCILEALRIEDEITSRLVELFTDGFEVLVKVEVLLSLKDKDLLLPNLVERLDPSPLERLGLPAAALLLVFGVVLLRGAFRVLEPARRQGCLVHCCCGLYYYRD